MGRGRSLVDGIAAKDLIAGALKAVVHFHLYRVGEWRLDLTPVHVF